MNGTARPAGPAGTDDAAIETVGLSKRYGHTVALAGLTMRVRYGQVFGFLGPNGAGKTTAVKLLLGLARPTGGGGRLLGAPLGDRAARRRVGYLPELFRYQPWLTARDVLGLHADLVHIERSDRGAAIEEALGVVGLADRGHDRVGTFSKGMQQRLGLGVALLGRPDVVFLDEPTSALDPIGRLDVRSIIHGLRERGTTVFLNSHLLTEVERVCDEIAIVDHGGVVAAGPLDELLGASTVRVRVTGLTDAGRADLARFGAVSDDPPWIVLRGCPPERVPDLVAALVASGVRVYEVDAGRESLEERFLQLLGHAPEPP
ncbi:MAG TPA: ABC transporter ATP-binding protein, partial [Candidatus Acidoferrum sp.]|nr:ABC transporter ATP-binding protein [Candidatus Acidoferrum sp.]